MPIVPRIAKVPRNKQTRVMNEAETELTYIDPALLAAGWGVVEGSRIRKQFPISKGRLIGNGQRQKPDKADYVLQYRNRNLAVIEAKKRDSDYTEGVAQAKDYAGKLQVRFTYSTNGLKNYRMDMSEGSEGDVTVYPSPDELWQMTFGEQDQLQPQTPSPMSLTAGTCAASLWAHWLAVRLFRERKFTCWLQNFLTILQTINNYKR